MLKTRLGQWLAGGRGRRGIRLLEEESGQKRQFFHRDTRADLGVMEQMFDVQDYDLRRLRRADELMACYARTLAAGRAPLILDAGANIGASAVYFATRFPKSRICCFEPEPGNFAFLERNTVGLNVELHAEAIGLADGSVSLLDPGEGEWGYRTALDPQGSIRVRGVSGFVRERIDQGCVPFIAKIDIEGGEERLFESAHEWVDAFPLVIIELHDWLLPRGGTSRGFLRCIAGYDRDFIHLGENIFSISNALPR